MNHLTNFKISQLRNVMLALLMLVGASVWGQSLVSLPINLGTDNIRELRNCNNTSLSACIDPDICKTKVGTPIAYFGNCFSSASPMLLMRSQNAGIQSFCGSYSFHLPPSANNEEIVFNLWGMTGYTSHNPLRLMLNMDVEAVRGDAKMEFFLVPSSFAYDACASWSSVSISTLPIKTEYFSASSYPLTRQITLDYPLRANSGNDKLLIKVSSNNGTGVVGIGNISTYIGANTATIGGTGNVTICAGQSTTLTANLATSGNTYLWNNNATTQSITVSPTTTTTYTVTITDASGGVQTVSKTVIVNPEPTITLTSNNTPICEGTPTTVTAVASGALPPFSYIWSNQTVLTANAATTISAVGTYTVTATAAAGCTATKTIVVNPVPIVNITGDLNIAPNGSTVLTANVTNMVNVAPVTYLWSNTPATTTADITVTQAGVYTVTVTSAVGCTGTASVTVVEVECYVSGFQIIESINGQPLTLSNLITRSIIQNSWVQADGSIIVPDNTRLKWVIIGNLLMDRKFQSNNFDFRMCGNAMIEVANNTEFKTYSTGGLTGSFSALNDKMWEGIKVRSGGKFFIYGDANLSNGSITTIFDAKTAIEVDNNGTLVLSSQANASQVSKIEFNKNLIAIKLNYSTDNNSTIIKGVHILGGALKQPYLGLNSAIGIEADNRSKPVEISYLKLMNLHIGIKANKTAINVLEFSLLQGMQLSNIPPQFTGEPTAVFLENNSILNANLRPNGTNLQIEESVRGIYADNSTVRLKNSVIWFSVTTGIESNNSNVEMNGSRIDAVTGVLFKNANNKTLSIEDSQIFAYSKCIHAFQNNSSVINIKNNKRYTNTGDPINTIAVWATNNVGWSVAGYAIKIDHNSVQRNRIRIENNHIGVEKGYGISLNSIAAEPIFTNTQNTVIAGNLIRFQNNALLGKRSAITSANCKNLYLHNNTITGLGATDGSGFSSGSYFPTAIQLSATENADLCQNTLNNTRTGVLLQNVCNGTSLSRNTIQNHQVGVDYSQTLRMGAQQDLGNTFTGAYTTAGARNQTAQYIDPNDHLQGFTVEGRVLTNQTAPYWTPSQRTNLADPSAQVWFKSTPNQQPIACLITLPALQLAYQEGVAANTGADNLEFSEEMDYWSKQKLYEELKNETIVSPILQDFKDSMDYTPTGDLTDVKVTAIQAFAMNETLKLQLENYDTQLSTIGNNIELLVAEQAIAIDPLAYDSQIASLKALYATTEQAKIQVLAAWKMQTDNEADNLKIANTAIQPILLQEINQKLVNDVYFSSIAKGIRISDGTGRSGNQKIVLQQIAAQCPYTDGAAVYEARSLLATEDQYYDDQVICATVGVNYRKKTANTVEKKSPFGGLGGIYPNPAHNSVVVTADFDQKGRLECIDMLGRTIETIQWNGGSAQRINLNTIESGMYWLRIVGDNEEIVQIGKLTVSK